MSVMQELNFERLFSYDELVGTENLKILIVSTPKTGNTWLRYLLSAIYDLPMVNIDRNKINLQETDKFGSRWVSQQHFYPTDWLLNWAKQNQVTLMTTIRHPGDVLVSFYHYLHNFSEEFHRTNTISYFSELIREEKDKQKDYIKAVGQYVNKSFMFDLNMSVSWIRSGQSIVVRYEDLWRDSLATLLEITSKIHPVDADYIERAIDRCEINQLRKLAAGDGNEKFFRVGGVGGWRATLPPEVIKLFEQTRPYPAQFTALGYTLDSNDPLIADPVKPRVIKNPFINITHFDNGVAVAPILVSLYLSIKSEVSQLWQPVEESQRPDSYFNWLNASSTEQNSDASTQFPIITNLSAYIYHIRFDLQTAFPDVYGKDRISFILWFIQSAQQQYNLDKAFIEPLINSLQEWSAIPLNEKEETSHSGLAITNLSDYLYSSRADLQEAYPDITGQDRLAYFFWLINQAPKDYNLDERFIEPIQNRFLLWANSKCSEDKTSPNDGPIITNFMMYLYKTHPEIQTTFPDILGRKRVDFATWLIDNYRKRSELERLLLIPVISSWAEA